MAIEIKAIGYYFHLALFIMLYKMVLPVSVAIQMKIIEQCFRVLILILIFQILHCLVNFVV